MIVPFNELGNATTGGTWAFTGSDISYPLPPSAYNAPMNISSFKTGRYVYNYTVTNGTCTSVATYTLNLKNSKSSTNNECTGATTINVHNLTTVGTSTLTNQYISDEDLCTTDLAVKGATLSVTTLPTNWVPSPTVDLWYKILLPQGTTSAFSIAITVNSEDYGDGLQDATLAIYTGTCGALVLVDSVPTTQSDLVTIPYEIANGNTDPYLYIRIGSIYGGYFNVEVKSYGGVL